MKALADPLRGRGFRSTVLRWRGFRDGLSARLDRTLALERP
jgi:hypothetical protein